MPPPVAAEERLREVYRLLGELLEAPTEEAHNDTVPWYSPQLPPLDVGSKLSATDLLNWWFRPPAGKPVWDRYFGSAPDSTAQVNRPRPDPVVRDEMSGDAARFASAAAIAALLPEADDDLATEDADAAVETFYEFLHAFGRGDVEAAMGWVADDYHVIEDDVEIDREGLRRRLEWLLETLYGWDFEVSLASVLEPVPHPYGILMYAEIQINGMRAADDERRCLVERRAVLLENCGASGWKIAAMSRPRI